MTALKNVAAVMVLVLGAGLVGCAAEHPAVVSSDAKLQSSGTGKLTFRAPSNGTVYVYNKSTNKLEYQGEVRRDSLVTYDPDNKRLLADDKPLTQMELVRGDMREIYFEPSHTDRTVVREERTVEHHD